MNWLPAILILFIFIMCVMLIICLPQDKTFIIHPLKQLFDNLDVLYGVQRKLELFSYTNQRYTIGDLHQVNVDLHQVNDVTEDKLMEEINKYVVPDAVYMYAMEPYTIMQFDRESCTIKSLKDDDAVSHQMHSPLSRYRFIYCFDGMYESYSKAHISIDNSIKMLTNRTSTVFLAQKNTKFMNNTGDTLHLLCVEFTS
jgi:hypothetical protein